MRLNHRPRDIHRSGLNWYGFSPTTRGKRGDSLLTRHHRMSHLQHDGCVTPLPSLNNRVSSAVTSVLTDLDAPRHILHLPRRSHKAVKAPTASLQPAGDVRKTAVAFNGDTVISSGLTSASAGHLKRQLSGSNVQARLS